MKRKRLKFILVLLLLSLPLIFACRKISDNFVSYPTDEILEKNFHLNKVDFNKLIKKFQEDSNLLRVNEQDQVRDSLGNKANLSPSRLSEYKRLFSKLKVQQINRVEYDRSIFIRVWGIPNFFIGGKSKYCVFTETPPPNLETSLDDIYKSGRDANEFKRIGENWYLYLDVW